MLVTTKLYIQQRTGTHTKLPLFELFLSFIFQLVISQTDENIGQNKVFKPECL